MDGNHKIIEHENKCTLALIKKLCRDSILSKELAEVTTNKDAHQLVVNSKPTKGVRITKLNYIKISIMKNGKAAGVDDITAEH